MAVILEILHPNGARTLQRLDALPVSVGRGLGNDLILDDPYVDAHHARIGLDEAGALRIEDLGSVNGVVANDARTRGAIELRPGAEVRLGRTTLRFRDSDEPVSPALLDDRTSVARPSQVDGARGRPAAALGWASTTRGQAIIGAVALGAFALSSWLGSSDRSSVVDALGGASGFAVAAALWAGVWAVASRAIVHRFHFIGHFAVASAVALAALAWTTMEEWVDFFFPDAALIDVASTGIFLALLCALIAGHLSLSSTIPRQRRWRLGIVVACTAMAIGGLAAVASDDSFTDVSTFSGVLKPVAPGLIPTSTVDEFGSAMLELRKEVDGLTKE